MNIHLFADHASVLISEMKNVNYVENTTSLIQNGMADENKLVGNLVAKEITDFLMNNFTGMDLDDTGYILDDAVVSVLVKLPKANLSERDAYALISPFHDDHGVHWREFTASAAHAIKSMLKERFLRRRVTLFAASGEMSESSASSKKAAEEALSAIRSLAEKLIEVVKLKKFGDTLSIVLPVDAAAKVRPSSGHKATESENGRSILLLQQACLVPIVQPSFFKTVKPAMAYHALTSKRESLPKFAALIRVVAVEIDASQERSIEAQIASANGLLPASVITLPLRLPSVALADADVAEEFSRNLIDRIYGEGMDATDHAALAFKIISDSM